MSDGVVTLDKLTDVSVEADDGTAFRAHRATLAAHSAFFCALFCLDFAERRAPIVRLRGVTAAALRCVVHFAYGHVVALDDDNVEEVYVTADYLDVARLRHLCSDFMHHRLTADNCAVVWQFARLRGDRSLEQNAWRVMLRHFEAVVDSTEALWLDLDRTAVRALLADDALGCRDESTVWGAAERWLLGAQGRVCYGDDLFSAVRRPPPTFRSSWFLGRREAALADERPRQPTQLLLALGGWSIGAPTSVFESFNNLSAQWTEHPNLRDRYGPRAYHRLAFLNDQVFTVGGFNGHHYFSGVRAFSLQTGQWSERAPMYMRRCYVSCATLHAQILVAGGHDGRVRNNLCELYEPSTNQWSMVAPMVEVRSDAHAAQFDDNVFVCGGFNGVDCLATAERYDAQRNEWLPIRAMANARSGVGAAADPEHSCVYAAGGFDGQSRLATVERYDPRADRWMHAGSLATARSNFGMAFMDGRLIVCGGFDGAATIRSCECFEPRTGRVLALPAMNVRRSAVALCVVDAPPVPSPLFD